MRLLRFYCEDIAGGSVVLDGTEAHHLIHVLRLEVGSEVELFDGKGAVATAVIEKVGRKDVVLAVEEIKVHKPRTSGRVIIATSIAKGQRFDNLVTQCTELGVDHIAAVLYERTVKLAKGLRVMDRYNKLAVSAAKQCGRVFLPSISGPLELSKAIDVLKEDYPGGKFVYGQIEGEGPEDVAPSVDTIVFVGPEGGFTADEEELFANHNVNRICVNENILRVETAAVSFAALLCSKRYNANVRT